jgi:hypothetical protein
VVPLIRLPYQVRIPASVSRLRRRARSFSDVGDTCFHGQRLGDAIAGEEKARSDHCGDEAPPHQTASGEVASTARRQGSRTHTWRRCRLRRSHLSLGNSRPQHSAQVVLTRRPEARLVHTLLRPCPTGRLRRPLAPTPMAPAAAVSWQVQRRRSSGSTPSRERAAHLIGVYVERSAGELGITPDVRRAVTFTVLASSRSVELD